MHMPGLVWSTGSLASTSLAWCLSYHRAGSQWVVTCDRRWGSGPCLTDVIDAFAPGGRAAAQLPLRMPVRDIFRNARGTSLLGGKLEVRRATTG